MVYLATARSSESVSLTVGVGARLPLFRSAIGRAILVGMTPRQRAGILDQARERGESAAEEGQRAIDEALAEHDKRGFLTGYGNWREDVNGIAVPIPSLDGGIVYGLNVGGPAFHVKKRQLESVYAPLLLEAAAMLVAGREPSNG